MHRIIQTTAMAGLVALANAEAINYVTNLDIWSMLAPCAGSAIDYQVSEQVYSTRCPSDDPGLQSCICSSKPVRADVTSSLSTAIFSSCGGSLATADQTSVASVLEQYCSQGKTTIKFPTPTGSSVVNAYITDLSQLAYLAPCAQSAVSGVVMGNFEDRCPTDAKLYAPCICTKVYDQVTASLASAARESCSNAEDASQASVFVSEYCNMNKGTTSFARPKGPPGDMTYYITGMPQFMSLHTCAQSGISDAFLGQTEYYCATGPQALASCACIKSGMSRQVSASITSSVKAYCESTATDDVVSAMSVWDLFCRAASGSTKLDVAESATQTSFDATGHETAAPTAGAGGAAGSDGGSTGSGGGSASESGSSGSGGSSSGSGSGSGSNNGGGGGGLSKGAIIAIAVLASVVGIAVVGLVGWLVRRRAKKAKAAAAADAAADGSDATAGTGTETGPGKPELAGSEGAGMVAGQTVEKSELASPQATSPSQTNASTYAANTVSPTSPHSGAQEMYSPGGEQPHEMAQQGHRNQSAWGGPDGTRYEMA